MINYLLRETKSQEKLRLGRLEGDEANHERLEKYYERRDEFIKDLQVIFGYSHILKG